jgi:hypothetical protein
LFSERLAAAERIGAAEPIANTLRTIGELRCFTTAGDDEDSGEAATIYERMGNTISEAESRVSMAVARAGLDPLEEVLARLEQARHALRGAPHADVGEVFARCLHDDVDGARMARERIIAARQGRAYGFWVAITGWWIGDLSPGESSESTVDVEWLHGEADARQRWIAALTARR